MYQNVHMQLNDNWINHESKSCYEDFSLSVKHWEIPIFVVRDCLSTF